MKNLTSILVCLLGAAERAADQLRGVLRVSPPGLQAAGAAFSRVNRACISCHQHYRNK